MLVEDRQNRKLKIVKAVLTVSCALIFSCSLYQSIRLLTFCGRDFRTSYLLDSRFEQLCMTFSEVLLSIAGIVGIYWRKVGPVYFVILSFILCTVMVMHMVDFAMGMVFIYYKRQGHMEGIKQFLARQITRYKEGYRFSINKVNKLLSCKKCCGIMGPEDEIVHTDDTGNELIPCCCPDPKDVPCTIENAYKEGCAIKMSDDEGALLTFQFISVFTFVCEFFTYQAFLKCFV